MLRLAIVFFLLLTLNWLSFVRADAAGMRIGFDDSSITSSKLKELVPEKRAALLKQHRDEIQELRFEYMSLTNSDWQIIYSLPNLKHLELGNIGFDGKQLKKLASCKSLTELDIFEPNLRANDMDQLTLFPNVTTLRFDCDNTVDSKHFINLKAFPNLTALELNVGYSNSVDLSCLSIFKNSLKTISIEGNAATNLKSLATLRRLQKITLSFPNLDTDTCKALASLDKVTELVLCNNNLTNDSYQEIGKMKGLIKLELVAERTPGSAFEEISKLLNLQYLKLGNGLYSDKDLLCLSKLSKLNSLEFEGENAVDGTMFEAFNNKVPELKAITFYGDKLTAKGAAALGKLTSLRSLKIPRCKPESAWMSELARLTELDNLEIPTPSKGADEWAKGLGKITNLKKVDLSKSDLTDVGVEYISALKNLEELNLSNTAITDKCISALSSLHELKHLSLAGCKITNEGLRALKELANIDFLILDGTLITDTGLESLGTMKKLKCLKLNYNNIDGSGLHHLAQLYSLQNLGLCSTKITDSNFEKLSGLNIDYLGIADTEITEHSLPTLQRLKSLKSLDCDRCGFNTNDKIPGKPDEFFVIRLPSLPAVITNKDRDIPRKSSEQLKKELDSVNQKLAIAKVGQQANLQEERAKILFQMHRYEEALPDFEAAIYNRTHPRFYVCSRAADYWTSSLFNLIRERAFAYNALKDYDKALRDAEAAVSMNRLSVSARNIRAFALIQTGKCERALVDLNRAIELDPKSATSRFYRSLAYKNLGKQELAEADRKEAQRMGFTPEYPQ